MAVQDLINSAESRVDGFVSEANTALTTAIGAVERLGYTQLTFSGTPLPSAPPQSVSFVLPTLGDVSLDLPAEPVGTLVFQDIAAIQPGTLPTLSAAAPTITLPTEPGALAAFSNVAPTINTSITFPEPPNALLNPLIDAPVLTDRAEPVKPQTLLPSFTAITPLDNTVAPTDLEGSFSGAYREAAPQFITMINGYVDAQLTKLNPKFHGQMAAIETQLTKYLAGGTGLAPEVEDAIYARAQAKNDLEAKRMQDAAFADNAARGFTLPAGVMVSALARARQEAANNNAKAANEIAIAQAEMEQKNLQFAVTASTGLRTAMVNATLSYMQNLGQLNGQALDYGKTVLSSILELYNTAVKAYSVKLEAYKAETMVFEVKLKSAMAGIELYRVEIAALQAMTQVDQSKVEVYKARIDTLTSLSNVYRAQIEAVVGRTSLEKLKLEVFQTQVQTYSAQVQSKNAEWQGYSAAIGGQTAKAQIFNTQVQAFGQQVQAYKAEIEAKAEVVRATATSNDARARQYTATMQGYQTVVQARGQVASTKLENQRQEIVAFQAQTQAAVSQAQVANEYYKSTASIGIENAKLSIQATVSSADMAREYAKTLAQLHTANATIHGSLAGSALAGMNTLVADVASS